MIKILFVAHSGNVSGGANRILLSMMKCMREEYDVEPCVLVPDDGSGMREACEALGIRVYCGKYHSCCTVYRGEMRDALRMMKLVAAPVLDFAEAVRINRALQDDIGLVYTNDRMAVVGGYIAALRRIPHIWHVRTFGRANGNHFPVMWNRIMARFSDRIVLISHEMYEGFSDISPNKKVMVYDGIDIERYSVDKKQPHVPFRLMLAGRLVPVKGQDDAVRALDILVNRRKIDAELYLAGETPAYEPKDYENGLRELVKKLGLENRVHFLGEVKDITALRGTVDVELVCSWCEAFGLVNAEAMCAGIPVVGTNAGGTPDVILDGVTGLLYEPRDPEALAEKLAWLHAHPDVQRQMGENGMQRARSEFSIQSCTRRVYDVIKGVFAEKGYEIQ